MEKVIDWLLEDDMPEIKYRTMKELLNSPKDDGEVQKAYDDLMSSKALSVTMENFQLNKQWDDYKSLCALAEFGLTRYDVPIDVYVERLIAKTGFKMLCGEGLLLRNLVALGYYSHPAVQKEIPSAFSALQEDGGFQCISKNKKINDPKLPHKSCYRLTASYLLLAAELKKAGIAIPQKESLIDYYLHREVLFRQDDPEKFVVGEMAGSFYPLDPIKIGLQMILYSLGILGVGNNPECEKAWMVLESKKDAEGRYMLDKGLSKPYYKIGKAGKPNKWITLYAMLASKYRTE